jgi:phosphoribosylformylglycinamidine synthase
MKFGVVVFPGSNCDHDAWHVATRVVEQRCELLWHDDADLKGSDVVILPGGFSYGDYLRCGAIAKFSKILGRVKEHAAAGGFVLGICNGFQILTECGLLPGALVRNQNRHFVCRPITLSVATTRSPFTSLAEPGQLLRIPVAHGEGCYVAEDAVLDRLESEDRVAFRYAEPVNGSLRDIAGVLSEGRNVLGMMPHPERASEPLMGSEDGALLFRSLVAQFVRA